MYNLDGKVALVTGTANMKGLGCGIALRLAREGADVVVTDKAKTSDEMEPWDKDAGWKGLESVVAEIAKLGRRGLAVNADLTSSREVDSLVETAVRQFGKIDILVNNAGLARRNVGGEINVVDMADEVWGKMLAVNLTGVFFMCRAVTRQMLKQGPGSKIVNISSIGGKRPRAGRAAYTTSKAGVIALTQVLALELAPHQINVNAVCPDAVVTWGNHGQGIYALMKKGMSEQDAIMKEYGDAGALARIPLGRPAMVEDVANMVSFLASSQSDHMTGQAINVTGGRLMER